MLQSTRFSLTPQNPAQPVDSNWPDVVTRSPTNWTAVTMFGLLAVVHLAIGLVLWHSSGGRSLAGDGGLILASVLAMLALASGLARREVAVLGRQRVVRLSLSVGPVYRYRYINFRQVRAVRLTIRESRIGLPDEAQIDLVCEGRSITCPPAVFARQQAAGMSVAMGVRLITAYPESWIVERLLRNVN